MVYILLLVVSSVHRWCTACRQQCPQMVYCLSSAVSTNGVLLVVNIQCPPMVYCLSSACSIHQWCIYNCLSSAVSTNGLLLVVSNVHQRCIAWRLVSIHGLPRYTACRQQCPPMVYCLSSAVSTKAVLLVVNSVRRQCTACRQRCPPMLYC